MNTVYDFQSGCLPAAILPETAGHVFADGCLCSGANTLLRVPAAARAGAALTVEAELSFTAPSNIHCGDRTFSLIAEPGLGRYRLLHYGQMPLAEVRIPAANPAQPIRVGFLLRADSWEILVNGASVLAAAIPPAARPAALLDLGFTHDCRVRAIRLQGCAAPAPVCPPRPASSFHLEVAVDFPDDLMHAPYDRKMFGRLFDEFASWGVRRCHWIHYGGPAGGWWRHCHCGGDAAARHAAITFANVGDFLAAAVTAAHARGIELYGLIKPFDMGFQYSLGENTPAAAARGRLPRIGGPVDWIADFAAENRHLTMARKPSALAAPPSVFTRIDLVKNDAAPAAFTAADVELWVSDDNVHYRPYAGPLQREEAVMDYPRWEHTPSGGRLAGAAAHVRVIRLQGLRLDSPYCALQVRGRTASFANDLLNLVHVWGPAGPVRTWTIGLAPRLTSVQPDGAAAVRQRGDFREVGVEFDCVADRTPTAVFPGYNHWQLPHALDAGQGFLAIARGRNPDVLAALSPSYPAARDWWLALVRECLAAGADGVELRVRNHHAPLAWSEFGFESPVREAFLARHGVDLWATDDFDRAAWRRLRGEAYTGFYRAARKLVREYGRKLGLHVSQTMCLEPDVAAAMEIQWDWRTWLTEGLADSVTMKEVWPGSRFAEEVLAVARPRQIPVIFAPYANTLWNKPGGVEICDRRIRLARDRGYDGFQFYECAAVMQGQPDGRVAMRQPDLRALLQSHFAGRPA